MGDCCNTSDGKYCTCTEERRESCTYRHIVTAAVLAGPGNVVTVPADGTWLVVDGVVRRASVDTQGYAGPQVHIIVTHEPWEDDDD